MDRMAITDGQKLALIKLCQNFARPRKWRLYFLSKLLAKEVESTSELSVEDWRTVRNMAYPNWPDNDWTIGDGFLIEGYTLYAKYEKEVLGQMSLFGES